MRWKSKPPLSGAWDQAAEFAARSAEEALATMAADPHVNTSR